MTPDAWNTFKAVSTSAASLINRIGISLISLPSASGAEVRMPTTSYSSLFRLLIREAFRRQASSLPTSAILLRPVVVREETDSLELRCSSHLLPPMHAMRHPIRTRKVMTKLKMAQTTCPL